MSLLCKWWWLLETGSGLWKDIANLKYVKQFLFVPFQQNA
jgi:hypothetical protein